MWLLLILLLSNAQAESQVRPSGAPHCKSEENVKRCIKQMMTNKKKPSVCDDGVQPDCENRCPSCIPKMFKKFLEEKVSSVRSCFHEGMLQKCKHAGVELEFCDDEDDNRERPECKLSEVTWEDKEGEKESKTFNISCPSCVPKGLGDLCKVKPTERCGDDKKPEMKWDEAKKNVCPSCFKVEEEDDCTAEDRKKCLAKVKTMNKCDERENAFKDDCCWSCKPRELPEDAAKKKEMLEKCTTKIKEQGFKVCKEAPDGETDDREEEEKVGSRDANGCRGCVTPTKQRTKKEAKCSLEDLKKCREDSPDCELEEEPLVVEESLRCCAPCIRPASKVNLLRVIACRKFLKECDDDDNEEDPDRRRNSFLPGEACPICGTKRPKCDPGCDDKQVCIRARKDGTVTKKCIPKRRLKFILKVKQNIRKAIKEANKETMTGVLKEFIQRYCEQNSEADRCAKFKDKLLDSLECTRKTGGTKERKDQDDVVEIEVEFGDEDENEAEGERRLLSETTGAESLLSDATKHDTDYVEGVETTTPDSGGDPTSDPDSSASSSCIFFTTVFLSILALSQF